MTLLQTERPPHPDASPFRDYAVGWLLALFVAFHGGAVAQMMLDGAAAGLVRSLVWFVAAPAVLMLAIRLANNAPGTGHPQ